MPSTNGSREDREMTDRQVSEDRQLNDADRLDLYRMQTYQAALPDLPKIPGYHVCWLSTTNTYDPVHRRQMLGYELIKATDIPGWDHDQLNIKQGPYEGYIGINEMVAARLPIELYKKYMLESHFHAPNREASRLANQAMEIREQARQYGANILVGEGTQELGRTTRPPDFRDG